MASGVENIGAFDRIKNYLSNLTAIDPAPLMKDVEQIVIDENRRRLHAGLDSNDARMPPTKRERSPRLSQRLGSGPPLAPNRDASRAIRLCRVISHEKVASGFRITIGWQGFTTRDGQSILGFHKRGGPYYPVRDITRISPATKAKIQAATSEFYRKASRYRAVAGRVVSRILGG